LIVVPPQSQAKPGKQKFSIIYLMRIGDLGQKWPGTRSMPPLPGAMADVADKPYTLDDLLAVMARLRDKDTGLL
jgi:hypothetical protein